MEINDTSSNGDDRGSLCDDIMRIRDGDPELIKYRDSVMKVRNQSYTLDPKSVQALDLLMWIQNQSQL